MRPTRARYKVLGMTVLLAGITYTDRVCISVTAPDIMRDLHLTQVEMSLVFSAFTLAYALFEIPTGWWGDRVGTRRVLTRIVAWWSTFTMLTGAAANYGWLLVTRFLFGVGEAGAWPNVARTFAEWFPPSARGTAQGIFFMGAHLAGGLTPLLVTALLAHLRWRALFAIFGSVGFLWSIAWYRWFRDTPREHPAVNQAECAEIAAGRGAAGDWKGVRFNSSVAALCMMYFTQSYGFNFYITWLPSYMKNVRGFTGWQLGLLAGLPLMLSVPADLMGGLTTDRLSRRYGLRTGRAAVGGVSLGAAAVFLIGGALSPNAVVSAVLIGLAGAASNFLLGAAWSTCIDLGGASSGVLSAAMNTSGQIGGILCPLVFGYSVQHGANWSLPLCIMGGLYLVGAFCWAAVR
ncbi:MAG TPA: MFS transporter [Candidatus Sulfopaludibacter sp.]|jgi:MFS family permease|nr:MFS transporter [Candidatus Sulfopaludibacter sp.]